MTLAEGRTQAGTLEFVAAQMILRIGESGADVLEEPWLRIQFQAPGQLDWIDIQSVDDLSDLAAQGFAIAGVHVHEPGITGVQMPASDADDPSAALALQIKAAEALEQLAAFLRQQAQSGTPFTPLAP